MDREIGFYLVRGISSHQLPLRARQFADVLSKLNPSVALLGILYNEDQQTSDRRAFSIPDDDPALRNQKFVVSAMLADIDTIQDLLVVWRYFSEELHIIDPRCSSFAAPADMSAEEARKLK